MAHIVFYDYMSDAIQNSDVYLFPYDPPQGDFGSVVWQTMCPEVPPSILRDIVVPRMSRATPFNLIGVPLPISPNYDVPVFFAICERGKNGERHYSCQQIDIILKLMVSPPPVTSEITRLLAERINMRPTEFGGGLFIYDAPVRLTSKQMQMINKSPFTGDVNLEDIPF